MVNTKEQETKVEVQDELTASATAQAQGESTTNTADTTSEEKERRLKGQITALQDKIKDIEQARQRDAKVFDALRGITSEEGVVTPEDMVKTLQSNFEKLQAELQESKVEKQRNEMIDSMEVTDAVKRELKRRVGVTSGMTQEQLQQTIQAEVSALSELFETQRKSAVSPDIRPKSQSPGGVSVPTSNDFNAWNDYMVKSGQIK